MSTVYQTFYLIRQVGTEVYEAGYGKYATPKLYTKSSAFSVAGKKNKQAAANDAPNEVTTLSRGGDTSALGKWPRYEAVPVTLTIGETA